MCFADVRYFGVKATNHSRTTVFFSWSLSYDHVARAKPLNSFALVP